MPNQLSPAELSTTWQTTFEAAICEQCDWRYFLPPEQMATECPHCFQSQLTPLTELADDLPYDRPPEFILPFTVSADAIANYTRGFASGIRFAPADLSPENLTARLKRVYLPMWLVDSQVQATWQAEVGFNYEVISHRDKFDENRGGWVSQEMTETRIRWEPRVGRLNRSYDNVVAPALEEHTPLLRRLGAYDLDKAQAYDSQAITDAFVRLPNRSPEDAWPDALPEFQVGATEECRQACQGDHFREFRWNANFITKHWTFLLLPMYVTYYLDDDQKPHPLLIHGQTGQLSGRRQGSMKRAQRTTLIIVGIAVAIFVLSLILAAISLVAPPAFIFAILGLVMALIVGLIGLVPLGLVWQFNRTN